MTQLRNKQNDMSQAFQWTLDARHDPAIASADWLARDIDPDCSSAISLITNTDVSVRTLRQAKDVFKTMRIIGETAADRQMGARMYLAAVASALVKHKERITTQSDQALDRSLSRMVRDEAVPPILRKLAATALTELIGDQHTYPTPRNGTTG